MASVSDARSGRSHHLYIPCTFCTLLWRVGRAMRTHGLCVSGRNTRGWHSGSHRPPRCSAMHCVETAPGGKPPSRLQQCTVISNLPEQFAFC
jgi:hypothetical protein